MKALIGAVVLTLTCAGLATAQTFSSGSTGADGALNPPAPPSGQTSEVWIQLPESGILNYTTVNIPSGVTVRFKKNSLNTSVIMLAQGDVTIAGAVHVNGSAGREGGPGGFAGGPATPGMVVPGFGPGAGPQPDGSKNGRWVGPLSLVPLIGGSGGSSSFNPWSCGDGLGGGGAIVIATSAGTTITGEILANGGDTFCDGCGLGVGAGGAIRVVANTIAASGTLSARGGCVSGWGSYSCSSFHGVVRLEAPFEALSFTGTATPAAVLSTINPAIFPSQPSSLSIVSVGGYLVPAHCGRRFDTVDLLLPAQLPDPIDVVVAASNIPVGTQIQIVFGTSNGGTVTPGTLAGSFQSSSATARVSGLNRAQLAYLFVSATFAVPQEAAALNPVGLDHVERIHVTAAPGAAPQVSFLRADGSTVERGRLSPRFINHFSR